MYWVDMYYLRVNARLLKAVIPELVILGSAKKRINQGQKRTMHKIDPNAYASNRIYATQPVICAKTN